jgi:hypothetical protein
MQSSPYNNPLFAQGLGGLVASFIGDPSKIAQNELLASEALLNNQTAHYRDAIGDTGLSGDLAAMMIRSLQAGPDYSQYAPGIGDAALRMGAMGFGGPELTPTGSIADMIMRAAAGDGRGRGGAGAVVPDGVTPINLTATEKQMIDRRLRAAVEGIEGAPNASQLYTQMMSGIEQGLFDSVAEAEQWVLNPDNWESEEVGIDNWLTSFQRGIGWIDEDAPYPDSKMVPTGRVTLPGSQGAQSMPSPKSREEYDALPSGTRYLAPDGSVRTKP